MEGITENSIGLSDYEQLASVLRLWNRTRGERDTEEAARVLASLGGYDIRPDAAIEEQVEAWLGFPSRRLAVYGTLAPGECNHWVLEGLTGVWSRGSVRGSRDPSGWGLTHGFPGLIWNPAGDPVPVQLFESLDLEWHWSRLDAFEGGDYRRVLIPVEQAGGLVVANIYTLAGR